MTRVTNQQLRELLASLGFRSRPSVEPKCHVWEHPDAATRLLLPANRDQEAARSADVLSVRTHLVQRGHLDGEHFEQFLQDGQVAAG